MPGPQQNRWLECARGQWRWMAHPWQRPACSEGDHPLDGLERVVIAHEDVDLIAVPVLQTVDGSRAQAADQGTGTAVQHGNPAVLFHGHGAGGRGDDLLGTPLPPARFQLVPHGRASDLQLRELAVGERPRLHRRELPPGSHHRSLGELGVRAAKFSTATSMTEHGLREVSNPSALFLSHHENQVAGSCITVTMEGTRPLLIEIQALVDESHAPNAKRLATGLEQNRLAMLLAVLNRHAGIPCFDQDVFINAVGGVKISEPAVDLAVLLSIVSSLKNKPLENKLIVFGEVGLAGEVRPVQGGLVRLKEAAKLGFTKAIVPKTNVPKQRIEGIEVIGVERLEQALQQLRNA